MTTTVPSTPEGHAAGRELIVSHESAHAALAILAAGVIPARVEVGSLRGKVSYDWGSYSIEDPDVAWGMLVSGLAGPLEETGRAPAWPLQPTESVDEKAMAATINYLRLDESDYRRAVTEAYELMATREYGSLHHMFAYLFDELGHSGVDHDEIVELLRATGLDRHIGGAMDKRRLRHKAVDVVFNTEPGKVSTPWTEKDKQLAYGISKAFRDGWEHSTVSGARRTGGRSGSRASRSDEAVRRTRMH